MEICTFYYVSIHLDYEKYWQTYTMYTDNNEVHWNIIQFYSIGDPEVYAYAFPNGRGMELLSFSYFLKFWIPRKCYVESLQVHPLPNSLSKSLIGRNLISLYRLQVISPANSVSNSPSTSLPIPSFFRLF